MIKLLSQALVVFFILLNLSMSFGDVLAASLPNMGSQTIRPLTEKELQTRAFNDRLIAYLYPDTGCTSQNVYGLFEAAKSDSGCYNDFGGGFLGVKMQIGGQVFSGGGCGRALGHAPGVGKCEAFPKGDGAITGIKVSK